MTRDDVLRLARQAWTETGEGWTAEAWFLDRAESFERFAQLVAAAEREECAKACEEIGGWFEPDSVQRKTAETCFVAIRARGES